MKNTVKSRSAAVLEDMFLTRNAIPIFRPRCYIGILPPSGEVPERRPEMEITDEEFMIDETDRNSDEVLKEAWPAVPSDETLEEFIGYLMDLDLRF